MTPRSDQRFGRRRSGRWAALALALGILSSPPVEARRRPSWVWNKACEERPPEGGGPTNDFHPLLKGAKKGLQLDPVDVPEHAPHLDEPDIGVFRVTAWNDSPDPVAASVEVETCLFRESCVQAFADFGDFGGGHLLAPGERRSVLVFTDDVLPFGRHGVTVVLLAGGTEVADRYSTAGLMVGAAELGVSEVSLLDRPFPVPEGTEAPPPLVLDRVDASVGVALSASVGNSGTAPEQVSAGFALDGGSEWSCGREIYSKAAVVAPGEDEVTLAAEWLENEETPPIQAGKHVLSILLYDGAGELVWERRGLPFEIREVVRPPPPAAESEGATRDAGAAQPDAASEPEGGPAEEP